jgi:hypothetical protein
MLQQAQEQSGLKAVEEDVPIARNSTEQPLRPEKTAKHPTTEDSPKSKKRRKTTTYSESKEELSPPPRDIIKEKDAQRSARPPKALPKKKISQLPLTNPVFKVPGDADNRPEITEEAVKPKQSDKEASESELSVLIDEEPKPRPKRQKDAGDPPLKKGRKRGAASQDSSLDPDQEKIKRLQGWLVKCGMRKMWSRELASYETPKAKIKHLEQMLKDAGMEGRYSLEKARQIREERELKVDLEQVQEGARRWGKGNVDEKNNGEKPRRRLARGLKNLSFLGDDGEETD